MQMTSIIFLDIPVGTGFSYARTEQASYSDELKLSERTYEFMRKVHSLWKITPTIPRDFAKTLSMNLLVCNFRNDFFLGVS